MEITLHSKKILICYKRRQTKKEKEKKRVGQIEKEEQDDRLKAHQIDNDNKCNLNETRGLMVKQS